jgi:hypothetical protein
LYLIFSGGHRGFYIRNSSYRKNIPNSDTSLAEFGIWGCVNPGTANTSSKNPVGIWQGKYPAMGDKSGQNGKPSLRIAKVEFVPAPDIEKRLARVYDLLLTPKSQALPEDDVPAPGPDSEAPCNDD